MRRTSALVVLACALALAGCGGSSAKPASLSPQKAVALAKANLDKTPGLHLTLTGTDLPGSGTTLVSADGTLTRAPAFDGTLVVSLLGAHPTIPVIAVGRILPEVGEQTIADGKADFVAMGRQLLADPDLVGKLKAGTPEQVRPCINCYVCV